MEDEAVRRAHDYLRKPVLHDGEQVFVGGQPLYEHAFSDKKLLQLLAKANPERYGRRTEQKNLLEMDPNEWTEEELELVADQYMRKVLGTPDLTVLGSTKQQREAGATVIEIEGELPAVETQPT
jgi:hypothetical protein